MDYKVKSETVRWHAMYSDLTGAEIRVVAYLVTSAEYKTGRISISYVEIADLVGLSKGGVKKALASLVEKKAINIESSAVGRTQCVYRVRSVDELNGYFAKETHNPAADLHYEEERKLFGELTMRHASIGDGCAECESRPGDEMCPQHSAQRKILQDSQEWREYILWKSDNPKPALKIKQINGRNVVSD